MANTETPFNVSHFLNVVLKTNITADCENFFTISLVVYIPITTDRKVKLYRGFGKTSSQNIYLGIILHRDQEFALLYYNFHRTFLFPFNNGV